MKTVQLDSMAIHFIDELMEVDNFYRNREKKWQIARCDGDYKRVGFLCYDIDKKCKVQLWYDNITGSKRWWFGFCFDTESERDNFINKIGCKNPIIFEDGVDIFPDKWLMKPVKEHWRDDGNQYFFGIYSEEASESKTIRKIVKYGKTIKGNFLPDNKKRHSDQTSPEHSELQKWLTEKPTAVGLTNVNDCKTEYKFECGDRVDILFEMANQIDAVIEVETDNVLPGVYQAIKYRALRCVERGIPLDDPRVQAIVVSKVPNKKATALCRKYNCKHVIIRSLK